MQTYIALVELARICANQAHFTADRAVARELWRMAKEYQQSAAHLESRGKLIKGACTSNPGSDSPSGTKWSMPLQVEKSGIKKRGHSTMTVPPRSLTNGA